MSGSGTRRTTILKRRAGKTARLIFFAKRGAVLLAVFGVAGFTFHEITHSAWYDRTKESSLQSLHDKLVGVGFKTKGLLIDGRNQTTREELMQASGIKKDLSIFSYDLAAIRRQISQLPWISTVTVERRLPDMIYISLTERAPVALYQKDNKLTLVDAEGAALTDKNLGDFHNMIIVTGEKAPQNAAGLVGLIEAEPDFKQRIQIARWIGNRRWDIELKNGVTVRLPEDDTGLAIKRVVEAQKTEHIMDRHVEAIDLRDANRIVVQTAPGAAQKYDAGYKPEKNI